MDAAEVNKQIDHARELMDQSIEHLHKELKKISTGKASTAMLDGVFVEYYGSPTPLNQVANVSIADSRSLAIQPWEKNMLGPIEKAIFEANLGVTPQNDGEMVRINIPPLTEDRRKDLVKKAKALGEEAKVSVRNARRDAMDSIKKAVKEGFPEDAGKSREQEVQNLTDKHIETIDKTVEAKEKDIMTV